MYDSAHRFERDVAIEYSMRLRSCVRIQSVLVLLPAFAKVLVLAVGLQFQSVQEGPGGAVLRATESV